VKVAWQKDVTEFTESSCMRLTPPAFRSMVIVFVAASGPDKSSLLSAASPLAQADSDSDSDSGALYL
jgi:hypothetical protein